MEYMNLGIKELHDLLKEGKVTSEELVVESLKKAHANQDECNSFVTKQ